MADLDHQVLPDSPRARLIAALQKHRTELQAIIDGGRHLLPAEVLEELAPASDALAASESGGPELPDIDLAIKNLAKPAGSAPEYSDSAGRIRQWLTDWTPRFIAANNHPEDSPMRQWIIDRWLPEGRVCLFAGEGGKGKSRLMVQLAARIAAGPGAWLNTSDRPEAGPGVLFDNHEAAPAVYASWEDEHSEFARRLAAAGMTRQVGDRLHFLDFAGAGPLWAPPAGPIRHVQTLSELTATGHQLREYCQDVGARLLVVDPLAAAYASDENNRGLVRAFMSDFDQWARGNNCAVALVSHPPKNEASYSGSTDWHAAARAVWKLEHIEADGKDGRKKQNGPNGLPDRRLCLKAEKSSYGPPAPAVWVEWADTNTGGKFVATEPPEWATPGPSGSNGTARQGRFAGTG